MHSPAVDRFNTLTRHLKAAVAITAASGHIILAGNFNVKVGNLG